MVKKSTPARALISPTYRAALVCRTTQRQEDPYVSETRAHDDGVVAMLLVVVEDALDGLDTRILIALVGLPGLLLVPI